jgi:hypothetical protein
VITPVRVAFAVVALLLNVVHIAVGRQFPIPAHDAAAGESSEAEESYNVTHDFLSDTR